MEELDQKRVLKAQVLFDYIHGHLEQVIITDGCRSDQGFDGHLEHIEKNTLYLQDLGYFKMKFFEEASKKEAYFVSRYLYPTTLLDEKNKPIDLLKELRNSDTFFSKKVLLGKKEKIKIRLVATRLSDEEAQKRIKKIKEKGKRRGKNPTEATLELAKWSIYITNVSEDILQDNQIHCIYALRWQIELFFKLCKSQAGIDKITGQKPNRILCEFYSKMIGIVIFLYLCFPTRWQENQELSWFKAYKTLKLRGFDFFKSLKSKYRLVEFIKTFIGDLKDFSLKDRYRKKRRLFYQEVMDATGQMVLV